MKVHLYVDKMEVMKWWVDMSYNAQEDCHGHTGEMMTVGKGAMVSKSTK